MVLFVSTISDYVLYGGSLDGFSNIAASLIDCLLRHPQPLKLSLIIGSNSTNRRRACAQAVVFLRDFLSRLHDLLDIALLTAFAPL